jgi:hypothetical protein
VIFLVLLVSFILIGVLIFLYLPQILNFTNVNAIVDVIKELKLNEFGDFVGGTFNPLLSFLTLIILLCTFLMQKMQIDKDREDRKTQQFENTFFPLLNLHNQALTEFSKEPPPEEKRFSDKRLFGESSAKIIDEINEKWRKYQNKSKLDKTVINVNYIYDKDPPEIIESLDIAYSNLMNNIVYYANYFHILLELLKVISKLESEKDELVYARIIRAMLNNSVLRLLVIYAHKNEEYKKLIERYSIFEMASFNPKIADDDEFPAVSEAVKFYDKKAFGL